MGKAVVLEDEGNDFAMIYEGSTTDLAMRSFEAYREKGKKGKLINIFSVKPVDRELIRAVAEKVEKIVTIENHSIIGGLGGLVADYLRHAETCAIGESRSRRRIYRIRIAEGGKRKIRTDS